MPSRTLPHTRATPSRTGGDDRPRGACDGNYGPWDRMAEHRATTREYRAAREEAAGICASCPLVGCDFRLGVAA